MRNQTWTCGCFVKVYVCPEHVKKAEKHIRGLRGQLDLGILDTMVSVSDSGDRGTDGKYKA